MSDRFAGIRRVLRIRNITHDIDEELAFHFNESIAELMREGLPRQRAEEEARRRFGNEHYYRRELRKLDRRAESNRRLEAWWQDVRYAVRRMGRWPGLTVAVVLTFSLGIGANATMFGIIDRLLLRAPEHIVEPDRVQRLMVEAYFPWIGTRVTGDALSHLDYLNFTRARSFSAVAAFFDREVMLGRGSDASRREAVFVTPNFFSVLGVTPTFGRFWTAEEDEDGKPGVAVLSHHLWRQEFGADHGVLGRTIDFGYGPYTVIGVAPRNFTGVNLERVDVWLPLNSAGMHLVGSGCKETHACGFARAIGRLASGATAEQATAELTTLMRQGRAEDIGEGRLDPEVKVTVASVIRARGPLAPTEARVAKWLAGVSLIVLLIACANVANLLLARMIRQQREIGIRLALGISRTRLLAQTVTESLLLAALGGGAALLVAWSGGSFIRRVLLPNVAWDDAVLEPRVLLFVAVLTAVAGLAAGIVPALQASRRDVHDTLRGGAHQLSAPASRTRGALTMLQAALCVVLLVGAGLFVRSLQRVQTSGLGFDPQNVLVIEPVFEHDFDEANRTQEFVRGAVERLTALPGVEHAAAAQGLPFKRLMGFSVRVPGLDSIPRLAGGGPYMQWVDPDYFAVLRLPIVRGRGFVPADLAGNPRVAIINETTARTLWPGQHAAGGCLLVDSDEDTACTEVVGVVRDTRRLNVREDAAMQLYLPRRPDDTYMADAILARVRSDPRALVPAIQRELVSLELGLRFVRVRPFQELIDPQTRSWTLGATMFTVFGLLALLVAALGLYSVLAFAVAQRAHELGIRAALGATRERLLAMVLGQGLRLVTIGTAAGLLIALLAASRIRDLLFETSPHDPFIFTGVAVVLLVVAILASAIPAWRATRVNPSIALRAE